MERVLKRLVEIAGKHEMPEPEDLVGVPFSREKLAKLVKSGSKFLLDSRLSKLEEGIFVTYPPGNPLDKALYQRVFRLYWSTFPLLKRVEEVLEHPVVLGPGSFHHSGISVIPPEHLAEIATLKDLSLYTHAYKIMKERRARSMSEEVLGEAMRRTVDAILNRENDPRSSIAAKLLLSYIIYGAAANELLGGKHSLTGEFSRLTSQVKPYLSNYPKESLEEIARIYRAFERAFRNER